MKRSASVLASLLVIPAIAAAQANPPAAAAAAPALTPDTVVASYDGVKITLGEMQRYLGALPPQSQQAAIKDKKNFVQQYVLMRKLSAMADAEKLDQKSPYKESLEFSRMQVLAQGMLNYTYNTTLVTPEDQKKYYEANRDRFSQVKVKVLYVAFSANPAAGGGRKILSEADAKAKIEKLTSEARGGADFVKIIKENSDDAESKNKDGDFGVIKKTDAVPEPVKAAVFRLKKGDLTDPIRQPNGFYVFRAEELIAQPYEQIKDDIYTDIKQTRVQDLVESTRKKLNLKIENEAFFASQQ